MITHIHTNLLHCGISIRPMTAWSAVLDHPRALTQSDRRSRPAFAGGAVGGECNLIVLDTSDVLHDAFAGRASWAVQLNEHIAERGDIVFHHACKLGFEGIVSKRLGSPYVSGRSRHWVKSKNPAAPAVKRKAEEDWGRCPICP